MFADKDLSKERGIYGLTLSVRQNKTDTCVNNVNPDETARNESSHQDLHYLPFFFYIFFYLFFT